jgi:hypothetical protein
MRSRVKAENRRAGGSYICVCVLSGIRAWTSRDPPGRILWSTSIQVAQLSVCYDVGLKLTIEQQIAFVRALAPYVPKDLPPPLQSCKEGMHVQLFTV